MTEPQTTEDAQPAEPRVRRNRARQWIGGAVLIGFGLTCIFAYEPVGRFLNYDHLNDYAADVIEETLVRDQVTFLVISAIKASMSVIEGSSVGVGFQLQVGDLVQPAVDYVDFFWNAFLYAFLIMGAYKLLLDTGLLYLGFALMGVGFVVVGGLRFLPRDYPNWRLWGRRCAMGGFLVAYLAPLSLMITDTVSNRYTSELKQQHARSIERFSYGLDRAKDEFLSLRYELSVLRPGESLEEVRESMLEIAEAVGNSFRLSLLAFLYYLLILLFDLLFFPAVSAILLYKVAGLAFGRVTAPQPPAAPYRAPAA